MLRRQMAVTIDGVDAFARWAGGDAAAAQAVRDAEHQGDVAKRDLLSALREAFVTPIEPEDLLSRRRQLTRDPKVLLGAHPNFAGRFARRAQQLTPHAGACPYPRHNERAGPKGRNLTLSRVIRR
jgi:hypothetical protein